MPSKSAATKKSPARKRPSRKGLPPQTATTPKVVDQTKAKDKQVGVKLSDFAEPLAKAAIDKLTLQTEAAINIAIGYAMWRCGERVLTIGADGLAEFSKCYAVNVTVSKEGMHTYRLKEKK